MSRFLIDYTKASDVAFLCTSAWEGGFAVGFFAGMCVAFSLVLAVRIIRGRA